MLKSTRIFSLFSRVPRNLFRPPRAVPLIFPAKRCFSSETSQNQVFSEAAEPSFEKNSIENLEFKAETKRLLDIVAKSLYQDKEVFLRELLSNSADALEKQRYMQMSGKDVSPGEPLQISVILSENKKQIVIQDTGIGILFMFYRVF